jgi:methyl-accepting chemotaxis protein
VESSWTFGRKVGAGFAVLAALVVVLSVGAVLALKTVVERKDRVIAGDARTLMLAMAMGRAAEWKGGAFRGYLLLRDEASLDMMRTARAEFIENLRLVRTQDHDSDSTRLIDEIERLEASHQAACDQLIALGANLGTGEDVARRFHEMAVPRMKDLRAHTESFLQNVENSLERGSHGASVAADRAKAGLIAGAALAVLIATALAWFLSQILARQVGLAVRHVQSSSSELQTAANQQATGSKEQSTAMNEITTTISELLATSRQIAESAQRVAEIAEDTAKAARAGEHTVVKTGDSIGTIRRQVDLIVAHMLDLGKKSQQIGSILEIINELSEQTNILAINATIEATGAGEGGRRFAVVADEIRKLADRVGGSTKEIRTLIDEIRAAVNSTVMTTEGGSKAVDAGARQFGEVSQSLKQIVSSVSTTTEAAREIGLSTKQQASAVEQVNLAISNVAQATKETEASAGQILQTASQLSSLSLDLARLVQSSATT